MSLALRPYSEYKDAGVAWLGKVPSHWALIRTRYLFRERSEKGFPDEPLLAATQTKGVVRKELYESRTVLALKDLHLLNLVCDGDFVISLRSFQGGIEYAHHRGIISPAYTVLTPLPKVHTDFFAALFKSQPYIANLSLFVTGIRQGQNIDYERLSRSPLPVPPIDEQKQISRFVSCCNRNLGRLIRAKRRLIELLNEEKQVIIHQAITRGLDPSVRLKPSGIEWLGDIPEHWERRAVGQLFYLGRGQVTSHEYIASHPGPYPVYSSQTENEGVMGYIDSFMFDGNYLTWTTDGAHAGTVFLRQGRFNCTNVCGTLKPKLDLHLPFFLYALSIETKRHVRLDINPKLTNNMMARIRVNFPPIEEQRRIADALDRQLPEIDQARMRAQRHIDLLREYRTRLIADVVTGKLDVRGVELPAPDEADAPDAWNEDEEADVDDLSDAEEDDAGE